MIATIADLHALPNWVVFAQVPQPNGKKPRKMPYIPGTDREARVNDPATWRTHAEACADAERSGRSPGVAITPEMGVTLIDRDGLVDDDLIETIDSYAETSTNGGTHILVRGRPPEGFVAPHGVEVYPRTGNRFLILTEDIIAGRSEIHDRTELLAKLFPPARPSVAPPKTSLTLDDAMIMTKCRSSKSGDKFDRLWSGDDSELENDRSRGDQAFTSLVAFYTQDPAQILRIVQQSNRWRDKWTRRDYQQRTISKALQRSAFYTPREPIPYRPVAATDVQRLPIGIDPCTHRVAELERQLADAHATIAAKDETIAAMAQTFLNPNLSHTKKMVAAAMATAAHAKRAAGDAEDDGRVILSPAEIADDYRPKPEPGEHLSPVNPKTGTKPRMSRAAVKPLIEEAIAEGLAPAEVREVKRTRANGSPYPDWEFVIDPGASLAAMLNPWAHYRPEQPKTRKVRESRACPHCGEAHPIIRVDSCSGCGSVLAERIVDSASGDPMGDKTSPIASVAPVRNGRRNISHSESVPREPIPFVKERRESRVDRASRREDAAADLASREPSWLADAPDPWDTPPQPALFPLDDAPPDQSYHFSAD